MIEVIDALRDCTFGYLHVDSVRFSHGQLDFTIRAEMESDDVKLPRIIGVYDRPIIEKKVVFGGVLSYSIEPRDEQTLMLKAIEELPNQLFFRGSNGVFTINFALEGTSFSISTVYSGSVARHFATCLFDFSWERPAPSLTTMEKQKGDNLVLGK